MTKINKGIALALTTALISGFANIISKVGVSVADPFVHTSLRLSIVALVLTLLVYKKDKAKKLIKTTLKTKIKLLSIGVIGGSIAFMLFFVGLTKTTAPTASFIHKTLFIWVGLMAVFFLRERISGKQIIGYFLILAANQVLFKNIDLSLSEGELMIFAATLFWAVENIIAKSVLEDTSPLIVGWSRITIGAVVVSLASLTAGKGHLFFSLTLPQIATVLAGATTLLFYVLTWYTALKYVPVSLAAALLVPATLITNVLSSVFAGSNFSTPQLTNGALTVLGISIILYYSRYVRKQKKAFSKSRRSS